jgi:ATP-dependent DNA helicase RecG
LPLIIIEEAHNFGLATLHQLRGRVGRKGEKSECVLITDKQQDRLEILVNTNDGFKIGEIDLIQRGYGSFFQKQQWGFDNFKSGKLNKRLFKIASDIVKHKQYNVDIIKEFSNFFLKVQDVNY